MIDDINVDFRLIGERIREARKKKGWSQELLAEKLDVSIQYMSRLERGISEISLRRLAQLSKLFDMDIEEFITGTIPNSKQYLDKELYNIIIQCSPEKQNLIYGIAKIVMGVKFI